MKEIQIKAEAKTAKKVIRDKNQVLEYLEDEDLAEFVNIEREFDVTLNITKDNRLSEAELLLIICYINKQNFSNNSEFLTWFFYCLDYD